ncbi:hypothetical protein AURDEDRAFT_125092 [Auricularia subglabra TFB-10046 SS5]|nr:hypothetical protein AURDEDRAFT_125092 [Auricularia subglabra TFB-10046 SS5]
MSSVSHEDDSDGEGPAVPIEVRAREAMPFDVPDGLNYNPNMPFARGPDCEETNPEFYPWDRRPLPARDLKTFLADSAARMDTGAEPNPISRGDQVRVAIPGRSVERHARYRQDSEQLVLSLDPSPRVDPNDPNARLRWDYDSAYAVCTKIPVYTHLQLFLRCSSKHALSEPIRMRYCLPEYHPHLPKVKVDVHFIPNVLLATFGKHGQLYLSFPMLLPEKTRALFPPTHNSRLYDLLYQVVIDPALWAGAYYFHNTYKAWIDSGNEDKSFDLVGDSNIASFSRSVLTRCKADPDFRGAFFVVNIRGVKYLYHFDDHRSDSAELHKMLADIRPRSLLKDNWLVDKGLELRLPGHCLQAALDSHYKLIRLICPAAERSSTKALMDRPTRFQRHKKAQITAFQSFTLDTSTDDSYAKQGVRRIITYPTDKHISYAAAKNKRTVYSPMTAEDLLHPDRLDAGIARTQLACEYVAKARGRPADPPGDAGPAGPEDDEATVEMLKDTMEGALRIEVTVTYIKAVGLLSRIKLRTLCPLVYAVEAFLIWDFMSMRLSGILEIYKNLRAQNDVERRHKGSLILGILACRMQSALFRREDDGSNTRALLADCGRKYYDSRTERWVDVGGLDGVYFPSDVFIAEGGSFRVARAMCELISVAALAMHYGARSEARFADALATPLSRRPAVLAGVTRAPNRVAGRGHEVLDRIDPDTVEIEVRLDEEWDMLQEEWEAAHPHEKEQDVGLLLRPRTRTATERVLTVVWREFGRNCISYSPNMGGNGPWYCSLTKEQTDAIVGDEYLRTTNLVAVFPMLQLQKIDNSKSTTKFDYVFTPGGVERKGQGFNTFPSLSLYRDIMRVQPSDQFRQLIRDALRVMWDNLLWIPNVQSDRIWGTGPHNPSILLGATNGPAPRIAVRTQRDYDAIVASLSGVGGVPAGMSTTVQVPKKRQRLTGPDADLDFVREVRKAKVPRPNGR